MTNEVAQFKYETLDDSTADFLRKKESNMREIVGKAYTELGRELKEARDMLAGSRYDGVFEKWYRSMGFTKTSVYNYIYYFAEVQRLNSKSAIETFEELPKGLAYEIAKPSAESTIAKSQAKAEVLDGKIDTLKAYKQRIQELESQAQLSEEKRKQAESLAESARKDAEIKIRHYGDQSFRGVLFNF